LQKEELVQEIALEFVLNGMDSAKKKKKEVCMKKVLTGMFLSLLFMVFTPYNSYGEKCDCKGKMGGDMPMMEGTMDGGMGMRGDGHRMWRGLRDLGLDEKQKEAIKEIKSKSMKDTIKRRADIQVARVEMKEILDRDVVDMGAAEAKLKQISSMMTEMRLSHIKTMEEVKAKLTPEQRKKFRENMQKHGKWAGDRAGKGPYGKKGGMEQGKERKGN
jgi:Spy/CpxP family protein refolding chaperone